MKIKDILSIFDNSYYGSKEVEDKTIGGLIKKKMEIKITALVAEAVRKRHDISDIDFMWHHTPLWMLEEHFTYRDFFHWHAGRIRITEWHPADVNVCFVDGRIAFDILLTYSFDVLIGDGVTKFEEAVNLAGRFTIQYWIKAVKLPIELVWHWMNGQLEGGEFQVTSTGDTLQYDEESYPVKLYRLFHSSGKQAIDKLKDETHMTEETYSLIKKRLSTYHQVSDNSVQNHSDDILPIVDECPNPIEEAVAVRQKDRERLKTIDTMTKTHSMSEWTEILHFESKGGTSPFIYKMEKMRLLKVEKTLDGLRLVLTDKGKRVISAF